jgi:hypothetical protein
MSATDSAWLDAIARLTGRGALVLDAQGLPIAADQTALSRLKCGSVEGLREKWPTTAISARPSDGATAGDAKVSVPEVGDVKLDTIAFSTDGRECLALLSPARTSEDGDPTFMFARKLGHDLRGPLNAMVLNLDLLRTYLDMDIDEEDRNAKLRRYMQALHREIGRLNELLTAALDRARA